MPAAVAASSAAAVERSMPRPATGDMSALPITIRLAVVIWRTLQPHQSAFRTAAMFLLMVAISTSMMLMIGRGLRARSKSTDTTAVMADHLTGESSERTVEFQPTLQAEGESEASATLVAPTALGPAASASRPAYHHPATTHVEPELPVSTPRDDAKPTRVESNHDEMDGISMTASGLSAASVPHGYPTTSYPLPVRPESRIGLLPQVQTVDTAPTVARRQGDDHEFQTR
jgi:hypothetical protein